MKGHIILDFEATNDDFNRVEIIEIGAVRVVNNEIVDTFQTFIKPTKSELTPFIEKLTGITWQNLEEAPVFTEVYGDFLKWADFNNHFFASWGDWDGKIFLKTFESWNLPQPEISRVNLKTLQKTKRGTKAKGLKKAARAEGLEFEGSPHRALDDALMAAKIFQKIQSE